MAAITFLYPEILISVAFFLIMFIQFKKNRKTSAPIDYPIVGMMPALIANMDRMHEWATEILKENWTVKFNGPWFLNMDFLATCDPSNVNHIFNANHANYPKGDEYLEIFDILGDGIFNADYSSWKSQRKRAHTVISSPSFRSFVTNCSYRKVNSGLVPLVDQLCTKDVIFDLQDVFLRLTFDMTCHLVFGVDPTCMSSEFRDVPFALAMDDAMEALFYRHTMPPFCWKLMRWLNVGKEKKHLKAWKVIDEFVGENIARKKEGKIFGDDVLTSYMLDGPIDDKFLRDTAVNLMLAGRDTTGVALAWFFWLLSQNPDVKYKILEEIKMQEGKSEYDFSKMVYLHAALCETLRLYPSVPFEHKAPQQTEVLPSGQKTTAKEKILFSTYSMGRMEGVWGKDCLEFRPERWIGENGKVRHEPSYKFLSFNAGPRTCLGKEIAFVQMKTVVVALLSQFEFEIQKDCVVEPKHSIILHMKNGLKVKAKKRKIDA